MPGRLGRRRPGRGFTLTELLVVIGIVAVLIGFFVPAYNRARKSARRSVQIAQFRLLEGAIESYRQDYGDYPRNAIYPFWAGMRGQVGRPLATCLLEGRKPYVRVGSVTVVHGVAPGWDPKFAQYDAVLDTYGGHLQYFTRFRSNANHTRKSGSLFTAHPAGTVGLLYGRSDNSTNHEQSLWDMRDGDLAPTDPQNIKPQTGEAVAFLYHLGDADDDNVIDPAKGETLAFGGPYLLVSPGADNRFTNIPDHPTPDAIRKAVRASDDLYSSEP